MNTETLTTGIIDVSHWDSDEVHGQLVPALMTAQRVGGVVALLAKATEGKDYVDPSWHWWPLACSVLGMEFGAYHYGTNTEDGDKQADWFLARVDVSRCDPTTTRLALDFERTGPRTMTVVQAQAFVERVHELRGRYPLLYGDTSFLGQITDPHDPLGKCELWPAAYGPRAPKLPPAWTDWRLFQYTDGTYGPPDETTYPRFTPGFGRIDRSAFRGTVDELRAWWRTP